jgi:hypothetical protein
MATFSVSPVINEAMEPDMKFGVDWIIGTPANCACCVASQQLKTWRHAKL